MTREQLRSQAASRRSLSEASEPESKKVLWRCEFCVRDFKQEKSFMSHRCKERERIEELRSAVGQAAYAHYSEWMKAKKRSIPKIETFGASQYYSTFIKFAEHALRTNIPNIKQFIKLMVSHGDVTPALWCRDNVYAMYLEWYDQAYPPEVQVLESLEFLKSLIEDYKCSTPEVFQVVPVDTLVLYIKRRKISPWFLASSKVFRAHLLSCTQEDKDKLERAMNMGAMIARIQKDAGLFAFFNRVTLSEGL
jgi:hypothetical protein